MDYTWDLSIFYNGYEDKKYEEDKKRVDEVIKKYNSLDYSRNEVEVIESYLKLEEEFFMLTFTLFSYSELRTTTNVNDMKAMQEIASLQVKCQEIVPASVKFTNYLKDKDIDSLASKSKLINTYKFRLNNEKEDASHQLSEAEEVLYSKLTMVSSSSWSELQSKLTSNLSIKVDGFEEKMPLSAVRALAYDKDEKVRKNAYEAELEAYKQVEEAVAMALNNIKREVNIMLPLRGYENALDYTLKHSHMSKATLDALIEAIKQEAPRFRDYYKLKAKALGHTNGLPFYDLFAPMGNLNKTYTFEEAKDLVLSVYKSFSPRLYDMGKRAFENRWIDVLPHEGKVGGAFCAGAGDNDESRVLTNFTGSLSDCQTLAHELGHAYHGLVCYENAMLNRDYPMQLAETASIFCETLMAKKLISEVEDENELLTLVEQSIMEESQCVIDILSRYIFETSVLETPIDTPLSASDMCSLMLKAQDESYGDGLDPNYKHPYMWLCKGHYYSAGLSFYNWPYAFGLLYGKGLYKIYLDNKEEFVKKYDTMLKNTALMSVEEVAATMGIDVTKKDFWVDSLKFIEEDIDLFEKLLIKTKKI